ncbi:MAG: hypothetical protein SF053_03450 [Bacteroidia bacterium]|nr:hypothetical protein [Bacteroidia bacterium]
MLFLLLAGYRLTAEGTAQLMPAGSGATCVSYVQGNDGTGKEGSGYGRPWYDKIYVHIADPATEKIYYGFTRKLPSNKPVYYQILSPDGSILCSGQVASTSSNAGFIADNGVAAYAGPAQLGNTSGYTALICTPVMAGDHVIQFNVNNAVTPTPAETKYFIHPFDVTVVNTSTMRAVAGRLFSYKWHLNTNSSSNKACMSFYTWTYDSLVVRMDMNGMQPHGYSVSFNRYGSNNTGNIVTDRRSSTSISATVPDYRVFLQEPDPAVYPTGTPGRITYMSFNTCDYDNSYCIRVLATKIGEINVYIDLDGDGVYTSDSPDVYFPYQNTETGYICIPWDGLDGDGSPISGLVNGTVIVQFLAGIVHFPIWDPETHTAGFSCEVVRPGDMSPLMYYDNSKTRIGSLNLTGCQTGCNAWTSNKGDNVMVNTWLNTITSSDTADFVVTSYCSPQLVADSGCTQAGMPVQLPVIDNDFDPDNSLDLQTFSVTFDDPGRGLAVFDEDGGLLTIFPQDYLTDDISLNYELCDNTPPSAGGPFCSSAPVTLSIDPACLSSVILAPQFLSQQAEWLPPGQVYVRGTLATDHTKGQAWIERSEDGVLFTRLQPARQVAMEADKLEMTGYDLFPTEVSRLYYRFRWITAAGDAYLSPSVRVAVRPQTRPLLEVSQEGDGWTIRHYNHQPGQLILADASGRELRCINVTPGGEFQLVQPLPPGLYLFLLRADNQLAVRRVLVR